MMNQNNNLHVYECPLESPIHTNTELKLSQKIMRINYKVSLHANAAYKHVCTFFRRYTILQVLVFGIFGIFYLYKQKQKPIVLPQIKNKVNDGNTVKMSLNIPLLKPKHDKNNNCLFKDNGCLHNDEWVMIPLDK